MTWVRLHRRARYARIISLEDIVEGARETYFGPYIAGWATMAPGLKFMGGVPG